MNDLTATANPQPVFGRCRDCAFGKKRYNWGLNGEPRVCCANEKVFGTRGMDTDAGFQAYADELHVGLDFGCVHFKPDTDTNDLTREAPASN